MSTTAAPPLISQHPSTSGFQITLHPLALLTISDYITRHTLRNQTCPIIGAILGSQSGREIAIEYAYEILLQPSDTQIAIDKPWFETKLRLFKETHPTADLLGWFTTTASPAFHPSDAHISVHQALLHYNESLTLLLMNPSPAAALAGGGKLPIAIYESVYEADDTDAKTLGLRFVPLNYTIDSGEAEMIGMDFVAKGAGNATSVPPAKQTKPVSEKGKEKAVPAEKSDKVDVGVQNDELLSNLTAKKNAINMLNARIKLLLSYLQNPPLGVTNHQILREIKSLTNSRLPLLRPANDRAYEKEKLAEESDVNLVILLGAVTKSIEEVRNVGRKSAGIDSMLKSKGKGGALDRVFDEGMDFGRRSRGGLGAFGF